MTRPAIHFRLLWQIGITLLLFGAAVGYLAKMRGAFDEKLTLQLQTASATDLFEGMHVTYKGFTLGRVSALRLTQQGEVQGQIEILSDKSHFFTQGAALKISKEKIVTAELVLQRNEQNTTPLPAQAAIPVVRDALAADITRRLEPLLQNFQQLMSQLADPEQGIQATMKESRSVMKDSRSVMVQTRQTMGALQPTAQQATETLLELEKSLAQSRETMASTKQLVQHIDATVGEVQSAPLYRWLVPAKSKPSE